jgi:Spy/CpxP family protein refolding chaperone
MSSPRPFDVVRPLALALSAALILGVTAVAFGQTAAPDTKATKTTSTVTKKHARKEAAEDRNEMSKHLQNMTKRLKLTDDQAAKVKSIMEAHEAQGSELRAKYKGQPVTAESKAEMKKEREALHADAEAQLGQVLTPEQMTEWKKMRAEHM